MGALIEPLPCRFDCDYEYETAVSSGTQGDESIVAQVDKNMFTLDDHPLDETVAGEQGQGILQKARETLCSTPLTKAPKIGKSKRKPNASVKTAEALAEAAKARKVAMERDYEQITQFREEEHRATMTYKKTTHFKDEEKSYIHPLSVIPHRVCVSSLAPNPPCSCSFAISTVPKSALLRGLRPFPDLPSSESAVLRGLTIVFFLAEGASQRLPQNPVSTSGSLAHLIYIYISNHLSPNPTSVISCSSAFPVGLGSLGLLFFCRLCQTQTILSLSQWAPMSSAHSIEVSTRPKLNGIVPGTAFFHALRRRPTGWPDSRKRSPEFLPDVMNMIESNID
ncbi:hypothetical protein TNCV_504141 [Trichonephila clavipes]|nr:hypothetical protein TNCV_504141 [Trichonephila clavipes]